MRHVGHPPFMAVDRFPLNSQQESGHAAVQPINSGFVFGVGRRPGVQIIAKMPLFGGKRLFLNETFDKFSHDSDYYTSWDPVSRDIAVFGTHEG